MSDEESEYFSPPPIRSNPLTSQIYQIKCDDQNPCTNCSKAGVRCEKLSEDGRSKRFKTAYVESLETRIRQLESVVRDLNQPSRATTPLSRTQSREEDRKIKVKEPSRSSSTISYIAIGESNGVSVYGPTSVYEHIINEEKPTSVQVVNFNMPLLNSPFILECISNFFKWQYPDMNTFIYRESFLRDFFHPTESSSYCSDDLIFAISALGARMSADPAAYGKADEFYNIAKEKLMKGKLDHPSITTVQSLLFLAIYDIGNGRTSSGWILSGIAFRMGFDLGFHLNPQDWLSNNRNRLSQRDIAIRSRIYWGCYMCDHFISLLLGRPVTLKLSDTTVASSEMLPDLLNIDDYRYIDEPGSLNILIATSAKWLADLSKISERLLAEVFSESHDQPREASVAKYNQLLTRWRANLPSELHWDQAEIKQRAENPTFMSMKYYYYIILLCLNRPFIKSKTTFEYEDYVVVPSEVCHEIIGDLMIALEKFEYRHTLRKLSLFMVYCCIIGASCILIEKSDGSLSEKQINSLKFLLTALKRTSTTWSLAAKSYNLVKRRINSWNEKYGLDSFLQELESEKPFQGIIKSESIKKSKEIGVSSDEYALDVKNTFDPNAQAPVMRSRTSNSREAGMEPLESGTEQFIGGPPLFMNYQTNVGVDWKDQIPDFFWQ